MEESDKYVRFIVLTDLEKRNEALAAALRAANDEKKELKALLHAETMERILETKNLSDTIERLQADKEILLRRINESLAIGEVKQQQESEAISQANAEIMKLRRYIASLKLENRKVNEDKEKLMDKIVALKREAKEAQDGGKHMLCYYDLSYSPHLLLCCGHSEAKARMVLRYHKSKHRNPQQPGPGNATGMIFGGVGGVHIIQEDGTDSIALLPSPTSPQRKGKGRPATTPMRRSSPGSRNKRMQGVNV